MENVEFLPVSSPIKGKGGVQYEGEEVLKLLSVLRGRRVPQEEGKKKWRPIWAPGGLGGSPYYSSLSKGGGFFRGKGKVSPRGRKLPASAPLLSFGEKKKGGFLFWEKTPTPCGGSGGLPLVERSPSG